MRAKFGDEREKMEVGSKTDRDVGERLGPGAEAICETITVTEIGGDGWSGAGGS